MDFLAIASVKTLGRNIFISSKNVPTYRYITDSRRYYNNFMNMKKIGPLNSYISPVFTYEYRIFLDEILHISLFVFEFD